MTTYSHRPELGISIAIQVENGVASIAGSFVNDGFSRMGFFHKERQDHFCRATARNILNGRLKAVSEGGESSFVFACDVGEGVTPTDIIKILRPNFKPTHDESDDLFTGVVLAIPGGVTNQVYRFEANNIWDDICGKFANVCENVTAKV